LTGFQANPSQQIITASQTIAKAPYHQTVALPIQSPSQSIQSLSLPQDSSVSLKAAPGNTPPRYVLIC